MSLDDNLPPAVRSLRSRCKRGNSLETPRALLGKVIEEKIHRNSSTFVFNTQLSNLVSTKSPKSKECVSVKPVDENVCSSDSEENVTADYLLVGNEETNMYAKRNAPTRMSPAKRKFKFSRVPSQALQSLHNVKETASPLNIVNQSAKLKKSNSSKEISPKMKPLEHYLNSSNQNQSSQEGAAHTEVIHGNNIADRNQGSKSVDRSMYESHLTRLNDGTQSVSKTKSTAKARKSMSVTIIPLSKSSASTSKEQIKLGSISSSSLISNQRESENSEKANSLKVNEASRRSLRLRGRKNSSNHQPNTEQQKSNSSPPQHMQASTSSQSSVNDMQCDEIQSVRSTKMKMPKNKLDVFNQMLGADSLEPISRVQKLHSTAVNIDTQTLGFDASSIEPVANSSTTSDRISQLQLDIANMSHHEQTCEDGPSEPEVNEQHQSLMELDVSSNIGNIKLPNIPRVPDVVTRHIIQHFSEMPIAPSSMSVINTCCDDFWKQTLDTLRAYSAHSHRQILNVADVELLLYRQGFARDRNSMNDLIQQYLPLDLSSEIISSATAGNHV